MNHPRAAQVRTATRVRFVGAAFGGSGGGANVTLVSEPGFPPPPLPWPRILATAFEKRHDDRPPLVCAGRLRALLLDLVFGKVLLPWVVLRPWLAAKGGAEDDSGKPQSAKKRLRPCENLRAVATVIYRALRRVGGPVHGRLAPAGGLREVDASAQYALEVDSAVLAWEATRPRRGLARLLPRRRLRFATTRPLANTRAVDGAPPALATDAAADDDGASTNDDDDDDDGDRPPTPVVAAPKRDEPPPGPWSRPVPLDADIHDWMLLPMEPRIRKRATFLSDEEIARLLVPEDDFVVAAPLIDQLIDEIAADMSAWADTVIAAVLSARNVRIAAGPAG